MSEQPIVALTPKSRKFEKSQRNNDLLLKCRSGKLELSFYSSFDEHLLEIILEKVLSYAH